MLTQRRDERLRGLGYMVRIFVQFAKSQIVAIRIQRVEKHCGQEQMVHEHIRRLFLTDPYRVSFGPADHAATFLGFAALERASKDTGLMPRSTALVIIRGQYCGGMEPLRRMAFAVPYETPMSSAKTERVGQLLMIVSWVMFSTVRFIPAFVKRNNYDLYLCVRV